MILSRAKIPHQYSIPISTIDKHLSEIVFTKKALKKYSKLKLTIYDQSDDMELFILLKKDIKLYSLPLETNSFYIDVQHELSKKGVVIKSDKFFGKY